MNKAAVVLLLLSLYAVNIIAMSPIDGVCEVQQCASVTNPNSNTCGSTNTGRVTSCPTDYYCVNATAGQVNGVCQPAILDNQYGCTRGGQYNQNPIPCANVNSRCNATSQSPTSFGYCIPSTEDTLTLGALGCQDIGCAPLLACLLNTSYPNQSSIDEFYCGLPPYTVGADCSNNGGVCGGSLVCDDSVSPATCIKRYSKGLGADCDEDLYECLPGLVCAGAKCSNETSSLTPCTSYVNCTISDEDCQCPYATLGGPGQIGQCTNEWGVPITAAYAAAEIAVLDCMFQNCWNAQGYADCPACTAQTCAYYDQLAAVPGMVTDYIFYPRNSSMFPCVEDQVGINGVNLKMDPLFIASACNTASSSSSSSSSSASASASSSSSGNNGNGSPNSGTSSTSGNTGNTGNQSGASSLTISFVSVLSAVLLLL